MEILTEEEYLCLNKASRQGLGDSALHKNLPYGKVRQRILNHQLKKDYQLLALRESLRVEYAEKVRQNLIRPPTRIERLIKIARGNTDNESVNAARRVLTKQNISWED